MKVYALQIGSKSIWGSFGILENVYKCFKYLTELDHPWEYYQVGEHALIYVLLTALR